MATGPEIDQESALELCKLWTDTVLSSENRRQASSSFYIAVVAALAAFSEFASGIDEIYIAIVMMLISVLWYYTIRYFKSLAKAKFDVMSEIEAHLPLKLFEREWDIFKEKYHKGRLWDFELTTIEYTLPVIAFLFSFGFLVIEFINWVCN